MATKGIVKGIVSNLVTVEVDGPVSQNEICYISVGGVKLMAEPPCPKTEASEHGEVPRREKRTPKPKP